LAFEYATNPEIRGSCVGLVQFSNRMLMNVSYGIFYVEEVVIQEVDP
jgi:hypothetical protein